MNINEVIFHPSFEKIANNLSTDGYSVQTNAISKELGGMLWQALTNPKVAFQQAGVGRHKSFAFNSSVRGDEIAWIDKSTLAGAGWLDWMLSLQTFLNARLFLGLFSFESHFARYHKGDYYSKHQDAFIGEGNRILSVVLYLNKDWVEADVGELVLYTGVNGELPVKIAPVFGTLVVFLSEEFPHEVLPTNCDRFSIAGWFRVNGSKSNQVDPPE